ncbi:MAG TPA: hypothetical protein VJ757_06535 [Pseudonocardiaceae bacterium]|nr:hypothetical protein [Pseudonocardiaceae bacterium]
MFDALSYAEIDGQHAELLPSRTVLSLFSTGGGDHIAANNCGNASAGGGLIEVIPIAAAVNLLAGCQASVSG